MISRRTLLKSSLLTLIPVKGIFVARADSSGLNEDEQKILQQITSFKQYLPRLSQVARLNDGSYIYYFMFVRLEIVKREMYELGCKNSFYIPMKMWTDHSVQVYFSKEPKIRWDRLRTELDYDIHPFKEVSN